MAKFRITTDSGTDVGTWDGLLELEALAEFFNARGFGPVSVDGQSGELVWGPGSKPMCAGRPEIWRVSPA